MSQHNAHSKEETHDFLPFNIRKDSHKKLKSERKDSSSFEDENKKKDVIGNLTELQQTQNLNDKEKNSMKLNEPMKNSETVEFNEDMFLVPEQLFLSNTGSDNCIAMKYKEQNVKTAYKIYIYELAENFNVRLAMCMSSIRTDSCGFGIPFESKYDFPGIAFHATWQFSLDIIIHHKLMFSPYRTLNPEEADVFFIPFYEASHCFCKNTHNTSFNGLILEKALEKEIMHWPYYRQGKPHLLAIGKIEKEESSNHCPLLTYPWTWNITAIGIEASDFYRNPADKRRVTTHPLPPFIVVPYPSYGHFTEPSGGQYRHKIFSHKRRNFILIAASTTRANPFRNKILDEFHNSTKQMMDDYYEKMNYTKDHVINSMWAITGDNIGVKTVIDWMQNSVFCLQPAGDSPTRKSVYDAIVCGCIPVFFALDYQPVVTWPFHDILNYSDFSVTVPQGMNFRDILEPYKHNRQKIKALQQGLHAVMPMMQYSFPLDNKPHKDAVNMILEQIGRSLKLTD